MGCGKARPVVWQGSSGMTVRGSVESVTATCAPFEVVVTGTTRTRLRTKGVVLE